MRIRSLAMLIVALSIGCTKHASDFCSTNADCASMSCNPKFMRCNPVGGTLDPDGHPHFFDGGADGPDGARDASHDATTDVPPVCTTGSCSGTTPICDDTTKACRSCASGTECAAKTSSTPACVSGACVQCGARTDCAAPTPACDLSTNTCVGCLTNTDCTGVTPICNTTTNVCRACQADADCPADPGVCMADGHCASPSETIYVQNSTSTCSETGTGIAATPLCSMQPVLPLLSATRDLAVVRGTVSGGSWTYAGQVSGSFYVVGQQSAIILPLGAVSAIFAMQSGTVSIRNAKLSPSGAMGISAMGGTLTLSHVTVDSCMGGGILLDGAAFDIENTTVTNNGPGQDSDTGVVWGGIYLKALPATGAKILNLVTIVDNKNTGMACVALAAVSGSGVFASGNNGGIDVGSNCGFSACPTQGATCGAQP